MARRSDHSRDELSALVCEAATALAAEDGLRGVTMRQIASRIGYAAGSIYNAVGDLDAVLLRVKAGVFAGLGERLKAIARKPGDPLDIALAMADSYVGFVTENRRLWSVMLEHRLPQGSLAPDWYTQALSGPIETVDGVLAPLFPDPAGCRRATTALWAALEGVASLAVSGALNVPDATATPSDIARSIVHRYLTGREP